jgi:D-apiose dehydrogenase
MNAASKLRVATIGAGYFSQFHHDAWARMEDVALVAICDRDIDKARDFAERWNIPAVYEDAVAMLDAARPDLVDIATPPTTHLELIELAAERGIATICQKAFCRSLQEAEEAVRLAEEAGIMLVVHENFRFQPWYAEIKRLLEEGRLGDLYQIGFRLRPGDGQGPNAYLDRQPYFQRMERFLVHETAIHFIDTFRYLVGEIDAVTARLARLNPAIRGEDAGIIIFEFASGVRGLFDGNRLVDHQAENCRLTMGDLLVEGARGVLRLDGYARLFFRPLGCNREEKIDYSWSDKGFAGDSVWRLQRHVVDHLRANTPLMNRARDYLANLRIEEAVYSSSASGNRETL